MSCNPRKSRELIFRKENNDEVVPTISGVAQLKDLALLGLIFQGDSKSSSLAAAIHCFVVFSLISATRNINRRRKRIS